MNIEKEILELNLDEIIPNRFQPREKFNEQALNELSDSIKEHGVISPIVVRKIGNKYEIVAGERRFKASQLAGKTTIPAIVANLNDTQSAEVALIENVQRRDLTPIEEAKTYKTILTVGNMTQGQLAERIGINQSTVANKLRLLELDENVQEALLNDKISERHARSLLSLPSKEDQREFLDRITNNRMTVRETDLAIKEKLGVNKNNDAELEIISDESEISNNIPIAQIKPSENINTTNLFNTDIERMKEQATDINVTPPTPDFNNLLKPENAVGIENNTVTPIESYVPIDNNQNEESKTYRFFAPVEEERVLPSNDISNFDNQINNNVIENQPMDVAPTLNTEQIPDDNDGSDGGSSFQSIVTPQNSPLVEPEINIGQPVVNEASFNVEEPMIDINPPLINKIENIGGSQTYVTGDLITAINTVRQCVDTIEKYGFTVDAEEFDFEQMYQIIIKINKK
jgi:ParB family chromosome partitioning protein